MHFEVLVEDPSGKKALDILIPKIIGEGNSFKVIEHHGIGHIPKNMKSAKEASNRHLLNRLPKLLQAYGKTFAGYPPQYPAAVIVVCDLDDRTLTTFRDELNAILDACNPKPTAKFCLAIEEGEAWILGDIPAIKTAYPNAKDAVLCKYVNDSICGTWELLADAVHLGGSGKLASQGHRIIGEAKSGWAANICPNMDVDSNRSPSFALFRDTIRQLAGMSA